jgi:hypothetical protein
MRARFSLSAQQTAMKAAIPSEPCSAGGIYAGSEGVRERVIGQSMFDPGGVRKSS